MARPKSKEPTKDRKISLRVTEANYMKIKSVYGSIQRFFDLMLKILPVLILVACKGVEMPSDKATASAKKESVAPEVVYEVDTKMYAKVNFDPQNSNHFGYALDVKCNDTQCFVSGKIYEWKNDQRSVYIGVISPGAIFEISGEYARGEICIENALRCYNTTLSTSNFFAITREGRCHRANSTSTKEALALSVAGLIQYNTSPSLENSIDDSECNY